MEVTQCRIGQNVLVHGPAENPFIAPITSIEQTLVRVWLGNQSYAAPVRFVTVALRPLHSLTYVEGIKLFKIAFDSEMVENFELKKINNYNLELSGDDCFNFESVGKVIELKSDSCRVYYSEKLNREACHFNAHAVFDYLDKLGVDYGGLIDAGLAIDITIFKGKVLTTRT